MALAFDTLGYAKRLRERGVAQDQAEPHAEAARDFIMIELVTRNDLQAALAGLETRLDAKIDNLSLRLTVRLGVMLAAAIAALAALLRLA